MFRSKRRGSLACVRKNVDDRCQMTCDKVTEDLDSAKLGESLTVCEIYCPSSSSRWPVVSVNDSVVVIRARKMRAV